MDQQITVYHRLAKRLDELPQGYPATENGVELRILKIIFTEDEAEMALKLLPQPETATEIAQRLGMPLEEITAKLDLMAQKGQIGSATIGGRQIYRLIPFVIGIYEQQRQARLTHELVHLFEEYLPILSVEAGAHAPHAARVIPVSGSVKPGIVVPPYEDIRKIIDHAKSFRVQDCICRREKEMDGKRCSHTLTNCLQYSNEDHAYDYFKLDGEIISKEQAHKIMENSAKEGLVHTTHNVKEGVVGFLCNCCSCCCGLIRSVNEYHAHYTLARSLYVAEINTDDCILCGVCKEDRCPVEAIFEADDVLRVNMEKCLGCGVCVLTCPSEAIWLVERPAELRDEIADDMRDWARRRMEQLM